jgi:hypothetical protein
MVGTSIHLIILRIRSVLFNVQTGLCGCYRISTARYCLSDTSWLTVGHRLRRKRRFPFPDLNGGKDDPL